VTATKALLEALREHCEKVDLEGSTRGWRPEQRRLVFPSATGKVRSYTHFLESVWQPLLAKAKLSYRKFHSCRHTYASARLAAGEDIRVVQQALGHHSISLTVNIYGSHIMHENADALAKLDMFVVGKER
jgi:integrase